MTTEMTCDCCDCILDIELRGATWVLVDWKKKCELHKDETDANLVQTVLDHNHTFDAGVSPTDVELDQKKVDRRAEQTRIRGLGPGVVK